MLIYYDVNKPKIRKKTLKNGKKQKKTQECLNNICIRFPTYENECYARHVYCRVTGSNPYWVNMHMLPWHQMIRLDEGLVHPPKMTCDELDYLYE